MKILVASTYLPPVPGGAEKVAWETSIRLAEDLDVHILTTGSKNETRSIHGVVIHSVWDTRFKALFYSSIGRLFINRLVDIASFDVVHSHMALPWGYVFRGFGRLIITCHGSEALNGWIPDRLSRSALRKAKTVTSPSSWLSRLVMKKYDTDCITIPNGVDTNRFRPRKDGTGQAKIVLFVGRLIERKGVLELLQAARALENYEFWFAGEGPLKRAISFKNTRYLGFVDDVVDIYNQATLCVFPSHWEPFGIVGLEAMACGKAVIATELGFSEYIDSWKDGVIINGRDVEALVEAIQRLMEDEDERSRIEANARAKALQYDWNIVTSRYEELYKSMLET